MQNFRFQCGRRCLFPLHDCARWATYFTFSFLKHAFSVTLPSVRTETGESFLFFQPSLFFLGDFWPLAGGADPTAVQVMHPVNWDGKTREMGLGGLREAALATLRDLFSFLEGEGLGTPRRGQSWVSLRSFVPFWGDSWRCPSSGRCGARAGRRALQHPLLVSLLLSRGVARPTERHRNKTEGGVAAAPLSPPLSPPSCLPAAAAPPATP